MTGNTSAASSGGGSNIAIAWFDTTGSNIIPIVFEPGMTWGEYVNSDYLLYSKVSYNNNRFGFAVDGDQINFYNCGSSYSMVADDGAGVQPNEQIKPNYTYGTTI